MDDSTEVCQRCGMLLHKQLAQFHICNGSDVRIRPANIPLEKWMNARKVSIAVDNMVNDTVNDIIRDVFTSTRTRKDVQEIEQKPVRKKQEIKKQEPWYKRLRQWFREWWNDE